MSSQVGTLLRSSVNPKARARFESESHLRVGKAVPSASSGQTCIVCLPACLSVCLHAFLTNSLTA